ncbi:TKL protein kinase, partial [Phytophthora nicotianae P1976]
CRFTTFLTVNMGRWQLWVNPRVAESDRWHSSRVGLVRSSAILGDHLVSELRELARASDDDMALARAGQFLNKKLRRFEDESRLLLRLADSARVIVLLQRAIESVLDQLESELRDNWDRNLESERAEFIQKIDEILRDEEKLTNELGNNNRQLQIMTLLKYQLDQYSHVLTPRELDVVCEVFDTIGRRGNVMVGALPHWFAASELEWFRAKTTVMEEGEEACERQAAVWAKLHHPNVRKFFGACHVGTPFMIHEACSALPLLNQTIKRTRGRRKTRRERAIDKKLSKSEELAHRKETQTWRHVLGCALGLQYVHERGLVHERLTVDNLLYSQASQKGVLSGMGLVRRRNFGSLDFHDADPLESSDIFAFGLAIFEILVKDRSPDKIATRNSNFDNLPDVRPDFIKRTEWDLLLRMCTPDLVDSISMPDVVHQLSVLARRDAPMTTRLPHDTPATVEDVSGYEIQTLGMTLEATLHEIEQICDETDCGSFNNVNRPVCDRIMDVYQHLKASPDPVAMDLVENFSLIVLRFYDMLDQRVLGGTSVVASICASGTVAGKNYSFHHDIDMLLRTSSLHNTAPVHNWQTQWKEARRRQSKTLKSCLEEPEPFFRQMSNDIERSEAVALIQFAASTQLGPSTVNKSEDPPLWFIPPYQVQLGRHIADGSFGAVHEGEWLDTDVVVKQVLLDPSDKENWEQFRHEADLWFSLNHPNLIKLYGACHQGRPFFVCEPASRGTLASYLKGKNRRLIWFAISDVALGLQHLHDRGIIHGDLKGNNILVCDNTEGLSTAKLADFGLSIVVNHIEAPANDENGALGAFRWKAPECLLGARPTFASDIYSLGMCIIEAITGQYPWGNTMPDSVVVRNVAEMQSLPPRPECMNDDEWHLVTRMCRYEPHRRIPIGAIINCAFNFTSKKW